MDVINKSGTSVDYESATTYMDDEIREALHSKLSPCTEQEFFTAYENAHAAFYEADWFLSENNPVW